jgi:uncharacterized protein (DUF427 family)
MHHGRMSLTLGTAPFGQAPAGSFNFDPPSHVVYVEDFHRRVRAVKDGATVVDSERVKMVHESFRLPHYAFPEEDVQGQAVGAEFEPHAEGYVRVPWDAADSWYEEADEMFVHPKDPYHRIDILNTSRAVRVSLDGVVLAESTGARALYETGLPTRYYLPRDDVRLDLLERSDTVTGCAYKGRASHWRRGGDDIAWTYEAPTPEAAAIQGRVAFYNERVDIDVDGERQPRPNTPWTR